jgi:DNA invertase Pin-like site-specific DNA recombinase
MAVTSFENRGVGMKVGYARVSTVDQSVFAQTNALGAAGREKIFD